MGVIKSLGHWRHYLEGCKGGLKLVTDHKPNTFFESKAPTLLSRRQVGRQQFLSRSDYEWEYRKGADNIADPLSRSPALMNIVFERLGQPSQELREAILKGYAHDPWFKDENHTKKLRLEDGLYYKDHQILVPESKDNKIRELCISAHHDPPYAGHLGRDRTLEVIRRHFFWPKMKDDVAEFIATCDNCQRNKASNTLPPGLLRLLEIPEGLWESISMDLITHLPQTANGNTAIVVFVDSLSKMVRLVPVKTKISAEAYAVGFVREVFALHGLPKDIVSDRDPRFTSEFFSKLCELLGVKQKLSTAFHPQTDGQTERMNRTLEEMLRAFVGPALDDWDAHLPCCEFAMNNAFNESIRTTPFFLNYGFHPKSPGDFAFKGIKRDHEKFAANMQAALEDAQRCMKLAQERQARYANQGRRELEFEVGDWVLLDGKNLNLKTEGGHNLGKRFCGAYQVDKRVSPVSYELKFTADMKMHDVFHVSLLRAYRKRKGAPKGAPPTYQPTGDIQYEVEEILRHEDDDDHKRWFEVRWSDQDISWISESEMSNCWDIGLLQEDWCAIDEENTKESGEKDNCERASSGSLAN